MILIRVVAALADKVKDEARELEKSHWPGGFSEGGREVPENPRYRCRAVRNIGEQNGLVLLQCIYEG